jgi:hypothetical protein
MPRGNAGGLSLGPGYLYIAVLGTTEPTDLATAWATVSASWIQLGYTDDGSEFTYDISSDKVEVAEELDPIRVALTARDPKLAFDLAEVTASNLKRALNGGTITSGTGIVTFEPPDLGSEVRTMIGFESEDHTERWVYRQCLQTGGLGMARKKGADKTTIACEFSLEKPASGLPIFKAIFASPARG